MFLLGMLGVLIDLGSTKKDVPDFSLHSMYGVIEYEMVLTIWQSSPNKLTIEQLLNLEPRI